LGDGHGRPRRPTDRLGLTSYEAKAYLALIRRDSSTAAQASRLAEVPRQRIYDVLASLVEKGFASSRPGAVVKYAAVAPELAVDALVARRRQSWGRPSGARGR
jgi:sugar-specific transcriptional regulator TrmB